MCLWWKIKENEILKRMEKLSKRYINMELSEYEKNLNLTEMLSDSELTIKYFESKNMAVPTEAHEIVGILKRAIIAEEKLEGK